MPGSWSLHLWAFVNLSCNLVAVIEKLVEDKVPMGQITAEARLPIHFRGVRFHDFGTVVNVVEEDGSV